MACTMMWLLLVEIPTAVTNHHQDELQSSVVSICIIYIDPFGFQNVQNNLGRVVVDPAAVVASDWAVQTRGTKHPPPKCLKTERNL